MKIKSKVLVIFTIAIGVVLLLFFVGALYIGKEARNICQKAKSQYQGDCVEALMAQVEDEKQSFRIRNQAIWALGQYGDKRALTTLEKFFIGAIPGKEPLDETISQYELKKAIKLASGSINITAWIWR